MAYEPKYYTVVWFDYLELHFFSYILHAYIAHVYLFIYTLGRWRLHFHSGRSLNFTDKFTILVVVFKCVLLQNYLSNLVQIYSI